MQSEEGIHAVKRRHSAALLHTPGVSGIGVTKGRTGNLVIALYVDTDDPNVVGKLPKELEGYPVETIHSGPFRKL